ncbi:MULTISPECIES: ABC-2 transporter permease [Ruminococcus]|uniref:ABC-2 family transporter protein n=1 Tax=Ruminococcus albus (strain ATCC 27210 / DSM 20455 / JCM 14654 / NCDO 2250 / 7) TaxID=697329 RepID=E6UBB0_RUMA7|nr:MULTISPECIES: ABC-2 transporter permease [Ruminococcus]ADU21460.1 hypothetical protein Rumal_0934 [Ruminococcus albus 7 = DSM 20455]MCR5019432.1 ABC-2 transporter permease [Ruminococcus sp.]
MKGLLVKERYSLFNTCKVFLLIPVVINIALMIGIMVKRQEISGFPVGLIFVMMGIMPASVINQEMRSNWHVGVLTMPYTRTQIVSAKYIITLIITLLTLLMNAACLGVCLAFSSGLSAHNIVETAKILFSGIGMGLLPTIIIMPLTFKFYGNGVRLMGALLGGFIGGSNMMIMENAQHGGLFGNGFIFMCVTIVLFFISWGVSILLFRKRDV